MRTSEQVDVILPKIAVVKAKLQAVTKGAKNPYFKSTYADLNTHLDAVEPLLEENGLVLLQPCDTCFDGDKRNIVSSIILDPKSGQYISSCISLVGESDMQKVGSAVTYARRYTLGSLLSMKAQDDDGEGSMSRATKSVTSKTATAKAKTSKKPSFRKDKVAKKDVVATLDPDGATIAIVVEVEDEI